MKPIASITLEAEQAQRLYERMFDILGDYPPEKYETLWLYLQGDGYQHVLRCVAYLEPLVYVVLDSPIGSATARTKRPRAVSMRPHDFLTGLASLKDCKSRIEITISAVDRKGMQARIRLATVLGAAEKHETKPISGICERSIWDTWLLRDYYEHTPMLSIGTDKSRLQKLHQGWASRPEAKKPTAYFIRFHPPWMNAQCIAWSSSDGTNFDPPATALGTCYGLDMRIAVRASSFERAIRCLDSNDEVYMHILDPGGIQLAFEQTNTQVLVLRSAP